MRYVRIFSFIASAYTLTGCGQENKESVPEAENEKADDVKNEEIKHLGQTLTHGELDDCVSKSKILSEKLAEQEKALKEADEKMAALKAATEECARDNAKLSEEILAIKVEQRKNTNGLLNNNFELPKKRKPVGSKSNKAPVKGESSTTTPEAEVEKPKPKTPKELWKLLGEQVVKAVRERKAREGETSVDE
jgi:hypothetical protein